MSKPRRESQVDTKVLREALEKMPPETARVVREACKKHGLLPGGGDKPDKAKP